MAGPPRPGHDQRVMRDRANAGASIAQHHAICVECGRVSDDRWRGWLAERVDDPETGEAPKVGLYCPECAEREFGWPRRR
jgi:hypothetical protein